MTEEIPGVENQSPGQLFADERIALLEQQLADREKELSGTAERIAGLEKTLGERDKSLKDAVDRYRSVVLRAGTDIPPELVTGDTIEAIDRSYEAARALVGKVRQSVEKEQALTRVPLGSPPRRSLETGALSPREKIQFALGGKK